MKLTQDLTPLRGVILAGNTLGVSHNPTTLRKWIRLNRSVFKVDRIDIVANEQNFNAWPQLFAFAAAEQIHLSPRISDACKPACCGAVLERNPYDLCLVFSHGDISSLIEWCRLAKMRDIPVRARVVAAPGTLDNPERLAEVLGETCAVTIEAHDPFSTHGQSRIEGQSLIERMNRLTRMLAAKDMDVAIVGLPFCLVDEDNLPVAMNSRQFFADHQQYHEDSYTFAAQVSRFASGRVNMAIENLLARKTSVHDLIDAALFPWITGHPWLYSRVWMYHKLTRYLPFIRRVLRPSSENWEADENKLRKHQNRIKKKLGEICSQCRFQYVCDRDTNIFKNYFPGVAIKAQPGQTIIAAPCETHSRNRYYDTLDEKRRLTPQRVGALAENARHALLHTAPSREISADTYDIVGRYTHHMPGAVRWLSFGKGELNSTVLARLEPPFTISYTVGGGIAEHAGFSFGRYAKILCPLIDYSHRITISIADDGCYALLRDEEAVRPVELQGALQLPPRLGGVLEPRISLSNIDGMILTQTVLLWENGDKNIREREKVKYSVIIISTRYTRRLQATLLSLAHQQNITSHLFEIIIGYVPGIDASDDLLDSIEMSFPDLRIVRMPFAEGRARSKGFMINEAFHATSGKWVLLMDADIILPPDTFKILEDVEENRHFIAPDGRKMLPPDITGKILLNELRPWAAYDEVMQGPGEIRKHEADGTPIGFFQCVRREILERMPYHELDHFEASDWHFGRQVALKYGREYRLEDFYVLHLDHGGSQWYGTHKHR